MSYSDLLLPIIALLVGVMSLFTDLETKGGQRIAWFLGFLLLVACGFQLRSNTEAAQDQQWLKKNIDELSSALGSFESRTGSSFEKQSASLEEQSELIAEVARLLKETFGNSDEDPTIGEVKTSLEANQLRTQLAEKERPETRRAVSVQYFPKDVDGDIVLAALRELGFDVSTGSSVIPDVATNVIICGDEVPLDAVKLVAVTLIRAGVKLRHIRRFHNSSGRHTLVQVGAGTGHIHKEPLTVDEIRNATDFPIRSPSS